ncbi:transporter associated domain-containing protein [bacterium endosymbiont of Pedicinus badii]|uniref:transporter associated domain-containing protein n=1 Tax=bacterium endosymbiont of Pedicinus badii TaxID=1719126 RepID=UPI0009B9909A|nr:transporter associated domain-containing protein [bacterium endosymbiont of Pedicinus badii]OQM34313.1 hypothetical protein AOQ89_00220 [bacterium endosymbiont of Pedicinus badii]
MIQKKIKNSKILKKKKILNFISQHLVYKKIKDRKNFLEIINYCAKKNLISLKTKRMIQGIFNINTLKVRDIMVPKLNMIFIKKNFSLLDCLNIANKFLYSRYPVLSKKENQVEGILILKDILHFIKNTNSFFDIKKISRKPIIVPESTRLDRILNKFQITHNHMAIVINEFGNITGLITLEDIIKLVFDNIEDEHKKKIKKNIKKLNKYTFIVQGLTLIEEFNNFFNTKFKSLEVDTIGGLIMKSFGYLPSIGEIIRIKNFLFTISISDSKRIIQVLVKKMKSKIL